MITSLVWFQLAYLWGDHADELCVGVLPVFIHIICCPGDLLEITGSLVNEGIQPGVLQHLPGLVLQELQLVSNDLQLTPSSGPGELVRCLDMRC